MLSFAAPAASGSVPPHQGTCEAALVQSRVLRRSRSSSTRPASIRSRLTPACSGLATLAADARRYADNGSSSRAIPLQKLRVPCRAVTSSGVPTGWTAAPCGTSKALAVFSFLRIASLS